jgi:serine/threonine protein kinase
MHRDVKPSNVLLDADRAVLTDFGIATFTGDPRLTQTGMVMGSPGFTAPERIRGQAASPASDLWSLGATLYTAVEGHGPYERRGGAITTMSAIINESAPLAPSAGALNTVIAALLRREPQDRPDPATASRMITDVLPMLPDRYLGPPTWDNGAVAADSPAADSPVAGNPAAGGAAAGSPARRLWMPPWMTPRAPSRLPCRTSTRSAALAGQPVLKLRSRPALKPRRPALKPRSRLAPVPRRQPAPQHRPQPAPRHRRRPALKRHTRPALKPRSHPAPRLRRQRAP